MSPIRTKKGRKRTSESESGPYSDRGRQKGIGLVRKRAPFGQRKAERERPSPKVSPIRTKKGRKGTAESESGSYSDRGRQKGIGLVRKRAPFGQRKAERERSSPKVGPIRTEEGRKRTAESESEHHSDRGRQKENGRFRKRVLFGQRKAERERPIPKVGPIRTKKDRKKDHPVQK